MSFFKSAATKILSKKVIIPLGSRVIFVYHDVSERNSPQSSDLYSTDTAVFEKQINFIKENFEIVSLDKILSLPADTKTRLAAISFDDGFLSVKNIAMPYLTSRGIPFVVFLNKTAIEENYLPYDQFVEINRRYNERVYLNAEDVKYLHKNGVVIGSHTSNHQTLSDCDEQMLYAEIIKNKIFLENLIGEKVSHLAIPYGKREHYNENVINYCKSAGHTFIYSTNPIYFSNPWSENESRLIPRIGLTNQTQEELCFLINRPFVKKIDI